MNVPHTIESLGIIGLTVFIMALFGGITLLIVFVYYSGLSAVYSVSELTHIPFLVLLAAPIWIGVPLGIIINSIRYLLKHVS